MMHVDQLELHTGNLGTEVRETELDMVVGERRDCATGVAVLLLREAHGAELPQWQAGAHIDLLIPGIGPRQYSLCGDVSNTREWRVGILKVPDGRGGSLRVHEDLVAGSTIRVRGPRNHFPLVPADNYLFIAGGIGITPILPMLAAATRAGADWRLIYGGRRLESMAFLNELATYGDKVTLWPEDENGIINVDGLLDVPQAGTKVYCCGPGPLLDAVEGACASWASESCHLERFVPKPVEEPTMVGAFEVELRRSGKVLNVPPENSILEVVEQAGVHALWSCGEGTCGTCEVPVIEGEPEHRDSILDADEQSANDCMMICVSRSLGPRLVLDL